MVETESTSQETLHTVGLTDIIAIHALPLEIWHSCMMYMDVRSLGRLAATCKLLAAQPWPVIDFTRERTQLPAGIRDLSRISSRSSTPANSAITIHCALKKRPRVFRLGRHGKALGIRSLYKGIVEADSIRVLDLGVEPVLEYMSNFVFLAASAPFQFAPRHLESITFGGTHTAEGTRRGRGSSLHIASCFLNTIGNLPSMKRIAIRSMPLPTEAGNAIGLILYRATAASKCMALELVCCELDAAAVSDLAHALAANSTALHTLELEEEDGTVAHGACGDVGVTALVESLRGNTTLTSLRLAYCGIRSPYNSIKVLASVFTDNQTLTSLSLEGSRFSREAMETLALCVRTTAVRHLDLSGCNITCDVVQPLVDHVVGCTDDDAADAPSSATACAGVRKLVLAGNRLRNKSIVHLADRLACNHALCYLDVANNLMTHVGVQALVERMADGVHHRLEVDVRSGGGVFPMGGTSALLHDRSVRRRLIGFPDIGQSRETRSRRSVLSPTLSTERAGTSSESVAT
eukprot:m.283909 g.283909  ORF g.283909 m.283909 type:complete len:520 (+) comp19891_c0_seq9:285-1844(+)